MIQHPSVLQSKLLQSNMKPVRQISDRLVSWTSKEPLSLLLMIFIISKHTFIYRKRQATPRQSARPNLFLSFSGMRRSVRFSDVKT